MAARADIVVIGAGIMGLSVAYQLSRRTSARVIVLEKGAGLGEGSTGASSAVCRYRYSRSEMVQLARDGIHAYQHWADFLGLSAPLAKYRRDGALWITNWDHQTAMRERDRLAGLGVAVTTLDSAELANRFPAVNPCGLAVDVTTCAPHECCESNGHLLEEDGGSIEPTDALQDLMAANRSRGVEIHWGARVSGIEVNSGSVVGVLLADGASVPCGYAVTASGPWCNDLLARLGLGRQWPLVATRIQMAQVNQPENLPAHLPVCLDLVNGIYFRSQGRNKHIIVGSVLPEDESEEVRDPDNLDRTADDDFIRTKLYALQHRLQALQQLRGVRGYSGLYTMNRADVHPVVGRTSIEGLIVANGFSGHGFKLAPAIGSLVAQAIEGSRLSYDTDVDPRFLSYYRDPISLEAKSVLA